MAQTQNWFQELLTRYTQQTPWFFQIVTKAGITCTAVGGGLLALSAVPHIVLPLWTIGVASNLLVAGVVMAGVAKSATTTPQDLPNNKPNPIPKNTEIDNKQE